MDKELTMDHYVFKRPLDKYEYTIDPINGYINQASDYIVSRFNLSKEDSVKFVKEQINKHNPRNPIVRFNHKDNNGDMQEEKIKLTDYLKGVKENKELMAPTFTSYTNPSVKKSVQTEFLKVNIKRRKENKLLAFKANQDGDTDKYNYHDVLQKVMKIFNNSLSGAYASVSTLLHNPSGHSTLTSITRCVSSIGNGISESFIAGNKQIRTPDLMYNYIASIVSNTKEKPIKLAMELYNIYYPTPEEVHKMLFESSKWYWRDKEIEKDILDYLKHLKDYQLAAVMYTNDFWHLKEYNNDLVKEIVYKMSKKCIGISTDVEYMTKSPEGVDILSKAINNVYIKGMNVEYDKLVGTEILDRLCSTAANICKTMVKYKLLFRVFFTTDILPISMAYIKDMLRSTIVLSDTDSTCASYEKWVEWMLKEMPNTDPIAIANVIATFTTQVMDHNIKIFARNMNVNKEDFDLLKMKSEFYWPGFVPTNVSKHYYATVYIQEGNVFDKEKLELKGVHMIGSGVNQEIVKTVHNMIIEINSKISKKEKIRLLDYIDKVARLEEKVMDMIKNGDVSVFGKNTLKDPSGYKQSEEESVYWHHLLWEYVFAEKYGSPGNPPYMIIKIPTLLDTKKKLEDFYNTIEDKDIEIKLRNFLNKYDKTSFGTFRPPLMICASKGLPTEFRNVIDVQRVVEDNMKGGYYVLETLGFYKKENMLVCQMGY